MDTSVFIARIFGLSYLVMGMGLLFNRKVFRRIIEDFAGNSTFTFYGGALALVIGIVIIQTHNLWVSDWRLMVTLIGWAGFIKGAWIIILPDSAARFMQAYLKNKNLPVIHSIGAFILGAVLTFFGYF